MRDFTAMRWALCAAGLALVGACFGTDEDKGFVDPYAHSYLILRNIDLYADFILEASDNPGFQSERIVFTTNDTPNEDLFWNLDGGETGPETREISRAVDRKNGGGCSFNRPTNPL